MHKHLPAHALPSLYRSHACSQLENSNHACTKAQPKLGQVQYPANPRAQLLAAHVQIRAQPKMGQAQGHSAATKRKRPAPLSLSAHLSFPLSPSLFFYLNTHYLQQNMSPRLNNLQHAYNRLSIHSPSPQVQSSCSRNTSTIPCPHMSGAATPCSPTPCNLQLHSANQPLLHATSMGHDLLLLEKPPPSCNLLPSATKSHRHAPSTPTTHAAATIKGAHQQASLSFGWILSFLSSP